MSEDSTRISLQLGTPEKDKIDAVGKIILSLAKENNCNDIDVSGKDSNVEINIEFCAYQENVLENMMLELQKIGAKNIVCTTWFDIVG